MDEIIEIPLDKSSEAYSFHALHYANLIYQQSAENKSLFHILKNRFGPAHIMVNRKTLNEYIKENARRSSPDLECVFTGEPIKNPSIVPKNVALEDIATVFASEFVREALNELQITSLGYKGYTGSKAWYIPFLRMNSARRRKLVSKVLDKILDKNEQRN